MTRPLIGISADTRAYGEETAQLVIERYMEAVIRHAGVDAVLIPARPDLIDAKSVAARLDGLLLTGSPSNVAPARYGDASDGDGPFDPGRDEMTARLIAAMIDRARPVLGICRGFQELNVAFGGTLARDLGAEGRPLSHHAPDGVPLPDMFGHRHDVILTPGGVLARAFGRERLAVNSVHFQGVGRLGEGLSIEAQAPDGVVEAISASPNRAPILAVQWHPEWQTDRDAASQGIFHIFGRALRGEDPISADRVERSRDTQHPASTSPDCARDEREETA
ncbi:gamma-glutamyl-gamma-aminobutyrate hydrolase family protein [Sphingomonas abietis]|uniref:Gamma-glutamyl-gamma-aminobutyrate hydrolase family protein n=1 Tax=Sphingomonas abietis TaxID=3012344 RepID=A0ABY7NMS9_9SPHN|nr:gamma-glutamyl-gamma-aminobutyrate hydrolase family protein [Sphingomonas abietis]WBO21209.1 gamma-glutamyl-gamma-aminobutyrate hydrolase family protein [Sphingomonas abietis]